MDLTIVIPYFNGENTIHKLLETIPPEFPVIVVNDKSDFVPDLPEDILLLNLNKKGYFSGAVNEGIRNCSTDVLVLNQDVFFTDRRPFDLIMENRSKYATIGERILGNHPAYPMGYIHGTFMFLRRDALNKVGLLDEKYYPLWGSTCEWQLRACRKGFKALPVAEIKGMTHTRKGNYGSSISEILRRQPEKKGLLIRTPPLISVIVPSYNHGRYLPDLINSLIGGNTSLGVMSGQTLQSFEIIIADDCSTDNTAEIMKDLADPWKGIKYVRTKSNGGTSVACNTAIRIANAPTIARIDSDDMREPESLEKLYDSLERNPHSFVYDHVTMFGPNGRHPKIWRIPKFDLLETMSKNQVHAGIMFPKAAWKEVGGYPEVMVHGRDDWAFNIALGLKGWCGVLVDYPGYLYRREGQNRTLRNTTPQWRIKFLEQLKNLFPEAYSGGIEMPCCGGGRTYAAPKAAGSRVPSNSSARTFGLPGSTGITKVEYLRGNYGLETYYGPATGTAYTFSATKRFGYVATSDLNYPLDNGKDVGILGLRENGKALFRVVPKDAPKAEPVPDPVQEVQEVEEEEEKLDEMSEEYLDEDDFTLIKGVGKKTAENLRNLGFSTFEDIANQTSTELAEILGISESKADVIITEASDLSKW